MILGDFKVLSKLELSVFLNNTIIIEIHPHVCLQSKWPPIFDSLLSFQLGNDNISVVIVLLLIKLLLIFSSDFPQKPLKGEVQCKNCLFAVLKY